MAPVFVMMRSVSLDLWKAALSTTTTTLSFRYGKSSCSSQLLKVAVLQVPENNMGAISCFSDNAAIRLVRGLRSPER